MRCRACNALLDDAESTNKDVETGEYYDMCRWCLWHSGLYGFLTDDIVDREDFVTYDEDEDYCNE